jgi:DNA helicase HerA-like ATPase
MDDAPLRKDAHAVAPAMASTTPLQIGQVTTVSGFKLTCLLFANRPDNAAPQAYSQLQIGALIKIPTPSTMAFGFINGLELRHETAGQLVRQFAVADVELLGELAPRVAGGPPAFSRGISVYPTLGAPLFPATSDDLARIYDKPNNWTVAVGTLHQDPNRTAYLLSQELLSKHSAILGTTGSGKSCALTLIVRALLEAHPNGHVVLLDPHGEYAVAFDGMAERITPQNLQLPYWLLSFDEIVEILCSKDEKTRSREAYILKDVIIAAKRDALGSAVDTTHLTVDTPTPYPLARLMHYLSEAMGKLDKPDNALPYFRLMTTIENLRQDKRYAFLFGSLSVRDNMVEILSRILRIPVKGKPITIFDLSAVPSEIVDVVVSLVCRLIFDVALWSEREEAIPTLLVCDEAHRYIPGDESLGFEPTRRSISRIAKEGRKYGVSLCLVTQRPSEISESILSQCSTVFALRMSSEKDQNIVRRTLPETASGLLNTLPALRQQEAIVVGEGVAHPMHIRFADLDPKYRPRGDATNFPKAWENDANGLDFLRKIVERWRSQIR